MECNLTIATIDAIGSSGILCADTILCGYNDHSNVITSGSLHNDVQGACVFHSIHCKGTLTVKDLNIHSSIDGLYEIVRDLNLKIDELEKIIRYHPTIGIDVQQAKDEFNALK